MSRELKDLVKGVLTKEIKLDSLSKQEFEAVEAELRLLKSVVPLEHPMVHRTRKIAKQLGADVHVSHIADGGKHYIETFHEGEHTPAHSKLHAALSGHPELKHHDSNSDLGEHHSFYEVKGKGSKMNKNEHCGPEMMKYNSRGQWSMEKMEPLSKPPVSEAQRKAMHAAAKGNSTLDIPKSVGKDFAESDPGGKLPEKKMQKEEKIEKPVPVVMDSDTYRSKKKHNPDMESPKNLKKSWPGAQWTLEKAIKPGPALDYAKMNPKPNYAEIEAKAPTLTYDKNPMKAPKYTGAKERAEATRAKLDAESKETAIDTIARRQKMNKDEGVLIDEEPSEADKRQMTAKNEMLGYGPAGSPASPMTMSEKEPHEDDPKHEAKEKKKAKKIKEEAEGLLDMHKEEAAKGDLDLGP